MVAPARHCDGWRLRQLLEDQLPEASRAALVEHLDRCAACCDQLEQLAAADRWWRATRESLSDADELRAAYATGEFAANVRPTSTPTAEMGMPDREPAAENERRNDHRQSAGHGGGAARGPQRLGDDQDDLDSLASPEPIVPLDFLQPSDNPAMLGRLGEYEIIEVIGRGGMGIVLKGYDQELNRYVAIKTLSPHLAGNAAARRRFAREAQAAAAVVHQHVVAIHAVDAAYPTPYLVMTHVPGESLEERIVRTGPLPLADILRIGMQVAEGLAAAHAQGLVHRDVKPANILLERNVERVLLTDFGLARAVDDASLTHSGIIAGTPQYMSPEQARGESINHRTDLFSLGSVLYAMCTGHAPFRAETTLGVLRRICESKPRPIRELNPDIPLWLEMLIARLHEMDAARRMDSAEQAAQVLRQCLAHVQQPTFEPLPAELRLSPRVTASAYWLAVTFAALLVGLAAWQTTSWIHRWSSRSAAPDAESRATDARRDAQASAEQGRRRPTASPAPAVSPLVADENSAAGALTMARRAPRLSSDEELGAIERDLLDLEQKLGLSPYQKEISNDHSSTPDR